jgi:hypothetical protein
MRGLTPTQKGNVAGAKIVAAAVETGILVSRPVVEGCRYDLVFDMGTRLLRVQCKWARRRGNVIALRARTSRCTPAGYVRTRYLEHKVDGIAAYCPDLERCYYVPIVDMAGKGIAHLRLAPARNNQKAYVKMAADYPLGAIAQLGERLHGMQEVAGSSPASSTSKEAARGAASVRSADAQPAADPAGSSASSAWGSKSRRGTSPHSASRR